LGGWGRGGSIKCVLWVGVVVVLWAFFWACMVPEVLLSGVWDTCPKGGTGVPLQRRENCLRRPKLRVLNDSDETGETQQTRGEGTREIMEVASNPVPVDADGQVLGRAEEGQKKRFHESPAKAAQLEKKNAKVKPRETRTNLTMTGREFDQKGKGQSAGTKRTAEH